MTLQILTEGGKKAAPVAQKFFNEHDPNDLTDMKERLFIKLSRPDASAAEGITGHYLMGFQITYSVIIQDDPEEFVSFPVTEDIRTGWGITDFELFEIALASTHKHFPAVITPIEDVLGFDNEGPSFYTMTNRCRMRGANTILFTDALQSFAEDHGNFYIIPSSVHEVLLIPDSLNTPAEELSNMLRDVNNEVVKPDEILSYTLYHYSTKDGLKAMKGDD